MSAADQERARGALLRLAAGARRAQRDLDVLADLWGRPPPQWRSCLRPRDRVEPDERGADVVARYVSDPRCAVRRAAAAALRVAAPTPRALAALAAGLGDDDVIVRIACARGLAEHRAFAEGQREVLRSALSDAVWTVRWWAACALAVTELRGDAVSALLASQPRVDPPSRAGAWFALQLFVDAAHELAREEPDEAVASQLLAAAHRAETAQSLRR